MRKSLLVSAALLVGLTGCGQEGPATITPETAPGETTAAAPPSEETSPSASALPTTFGAGEYYFEYMGATGTITMPSDPVADVEEIREMAGVDPVTYATVKVDNRKGSEYINMYGISVYSPAGEEFEFVDASSAIADWPIDSEVVGVDAYNRSVDVNNKYLDGADPLQVKEFVMVGQFPELPEEFAGISVMPSGGFDSVLAVPEHLKDQFGEMNPEVGPQPDAPPMDY